ncbi:MAG: hypothetical protein P8O87_00810 [Crocinitomicaceae bacterium]|jgi:hypothetical protein|nr:hypothetical protein [Crocinitomicaceae bacterium]
MKKIKLIFLLLLACPIMALHAQVSPQFGFAGDRNNTFVVGSQNSIAIWKQWCALHAEGDVEGIVALAADSIRIEAPGGEVVIEGKEQLEGFLNKWFDENEQVSVFPEWGAPLKFINQEGNPIDGDWISSSFSLQINNGSETSVEQNHANVYILNDKVQYFRVFQYSTSKLVSVTLSVDMTSYEGKYASVGVFGTFNDWCGTCNPMTDIDGDGVYTSTIEVIPGQFQYKFILDNQAVEESFEPGSPCTETTDIYTNRLLLVEGNMTAETVCFDSCVSCD